MRPLAAVLAVCFLSQKLELICVPRWSSILISDGLKTIGFSDFILEFTSRVYLFITELLLSVCF